MTLVLLNGGDLDGKRVEVPKGATEYRQYVDGKCAASRTPVPGEGHPLVVVTPARQIVYRRAFDDQFVVVEAQTR